MKMRHRISAHRFVLFPVQAIVEEKRLAVITKAQKEYNNWKHARYGYLTLLYALSP
jgi:hypothetical protein